MTDAVLSGSYAGFRLVKTRRVVVVEVELPIEQLRQVVDVLGTPDPATETPVAVALLQQVPDRPGASTVLTAGAQREGASRPPDSKPDGAAARPPTPKRAWHELTRAQQAGIRCGEERFYAFLCQEFGATLTRCHDDPAEFVRQHCLVTTRANLDVTDVGSSRWDALDAEYRAWAGLEAEPR